MSDSRTHVLSRLNRRQFIGGVGGALAATALPGLATRALAQDILLEAPQLTDLVNQGKLPPLAQRLPASPAVVTPVEGVGQYGGTWTTATTGAGDSAWWWRTTGYEGLTCVNVETGGVEPCLAESYASNEDGTEFRFKLREGLKWSDGEPMTAADIVFWWEDFTLNKDLWPAGAPAFMRTASGAGSVTANGDYEVVFSFKEPNGFLPNWLATNLGNPVTAMPRHYLSQFHIAHNSDAENLAKQEGFNSWPDLFLNKAGAATLHQAAGLPVVRPWQMTTVLGTGSRLVFDRNPYYYKVDTNGSQLPYIDRVVFEIIEDPQVMLLKASNGELNYHLRHINSPQNKPVLARNAAERNYTLIDLEPSTMNEGVIGLNLTIDDENKRKLYNIREFRVALSHGTNRTEIINAVYQRQSQPWQAAPRPGNKFYHEKLATQYLEYDVALANDILDQAGFKDRNSAGIRLGPDGQPIKISFLASTTGGAQEALLIDVEQILKQQWAQIGIDMDSTAMERSLFITRTGNEEQDALMWTGFGGHPLTLPVDPRWFLPTSTSQSNWAKKWAVWFNTNGNDGWEPPADIKTGFGYYRDAMATPDDSERDELLMAILDIAAEGFYNIGTVLALPTYSIKTNNFHNVPMAQPDCWPYPSPGQVRSEQFWMSKA